MVRNQIMSQEETSSKIQIESINKKADKLCKQQLQEVQEVQEGQEVQQLQDHLVQKKQENKIVWKDTPESR